MVDIQYSIKEKSAQLSTELIAKTLGIPVEDTRLVEVQRNLLSVLEETCVIKPITEDYEEFSTDAIRNALHFFETDIVDSPLYYILPEAMVDAVVEVLTQVLAKREATLLKGRR